MYKILGSDGNEYDSVPTEKIQQWIRENRVDKKTPVMPDGADDWIFLGDLPEFAEAFTSAQKAEPGGSAKKGWWRMAAYLGLFLFVVTAVFIILKKVKHH